MKYIGCLTSSKICGSKRDNGLNVMNENTNENAHFVQDLNFNVKGSILVTRIQIFQLIENSLFVYNFINHFDRVKNNCVVLLHLKANFLFH